MAEYGHDTTTDEVLDGIDLSGRRALVTGASSGLGTETVRALAAKGCAVTFTARDLDKGQAVVDQVRASTGNDDVEMMSLELASLADVRRFADDYLSQHDRLDMLINNAGIMACPQGTTHDGFELQFGTNHLGHFLMTVLIAPALLAADSARIVALSSRAHHRSPMRFDDPWFSDGSYEKWTAYGQSKTANILFAVELQRRLAGRGVEAFAVHPGVIITELGRHLTEEDIAAATAAAPGGVLRTKTYEAGAATSVYAATAAELAGRGGCYLEDCGVAEVDETSSEHGVRSYALDPAAAERLWAMSVDLVGADLPH